MKLVLKVSAMALAAMTAVSSANAQSIVGAVGGVINSGGPGFGTLNETWNQAGLLSNYVSGVTDFNTFTATARHTFVFFGFEWFSVQNSTSASVTYDLGALMGIDGMALWNDEAAGIGSLNLLGSSDNISFSNLALGLSPSNPASSVTNYGADVFGFGTATLRYVRLDMSQCPQPNSSFPSCSIGEVAFRTASTTVPEPGTYALMLGGLAGLGLVARRRRSI